MNATELTDFFLKHRGRCFGGWTTDKLFKYILVNCVRRNVFAARDRFGLIAVAAIAWLDDAARITDLDARRLPQFQWEPEHPKGGSATGQWTPNGDSILIADVAGDRKFMPEILKQVTARWADAPCERLFTYRRGKLIELHWTTVMRFSQMRNIPRPGHQRTIGNQSPVTAVQTAGNPG